ncbi:MAG: PorV/PorQ family protein [Bacteroidota bacterium]
MTVAFASAQAPKYSNEFLSIGVGARPMGLSGAVVAIDDDATAAMWNPAGLSRCKGDLQLSAMHAELFAGISKFDYATLATHIDTARTIGFSIVRFGTDDIPNTLDLVDASGLIDYSRLSSFSIADYAFVFTYSQQTRLPGLRIGGNAKVIHRKVGDFGKAWGFGFDLGAQYAVGQWQFGVMAKDVTSTFNAWSYNTELLEATFSKTGNEIPKNSTEITLPKLIPGAAYRHDFNEKFTLLAELDAELTFDGQRNVLIGSSVVNIDPRIGLEAGYAGLVFLRAGLQNVQKVKEFDGTTSTIFQPNLGIGVKLGKIAIDYALTNIGSQQILYSNIFSIRLEITKQKR